MMSEMKKSSHRVFLIVNGTIKFSECAIEVRHCGEKIRAAMETC